MQKKLILAFTVLQIFLVGCSANPVRESGIDSVLKRENKFTSYPQANMTYLSFSKGHGYQVNFIDYNGKSWLWYPGNRASLPEEWKLQTVGKVDAVCWRHPTNSYNPVTKQIGGDFSCSPLILSQKATIAAIKGDRFNLKSGRIPYVLDRCTAPDAFQFDRVKFGC